MTSAATNPGSGGTTSPTKHELIRFARLALGNAEIPFSQNKVVRLALKFRDRCPGGSGLMFYLFLVHEVGMSEEQQATARQNPDIAHALSHFDPTPAIAIRNVMRKRG